MIKIFFEAGIHYPRKIEENGSIIKDDSLNKYSFFIPSAEDAIKKNSLHILLQELLKGLQVIRIQ